MRNRFVLSPFFLGARVSGLAALAEGDGWVNDAHGDFNTPETSPSGFLGGMPLAILVGRGGDALRSGLRLDPLPEERVVLTDARDLDPLERELLASSALTHRPRVEDLLTHPPPEGTSRRVTLGLLDDLLG